MKKIVMITLCLALSIVSYTFAAQTLTVTCANGAVEVSNVPDSMTSSDLNPEYRCPRNGGTWSVDAGVEVETEISTETGSAMEDEMEDKMEDEMEEGVLISAKVVRSQSGLVVLNVQDAIDYLHANGLTMFATEETFMGTSSLRRDEAAAFFARFARDVLKMEVNADAEGCEFSDLSDAHKDLTDEVVVACQLGLFKGSDGKFMARATLTNAQALAVLVRLLDGEKEEVAGNWAANYYAFAQKAGLTVSLHADMEEHLSLAITRADVAKMIEAASVYRVEHSGDPHENIVEEVETETVVETGSAQ